MGRNNWKQEDADAYDRQAVQDCKEASVRSLQSGQVQCGLGWRGWADDWAVRRRLAEQSLQALEQNDIGRRLAWCGPRLRPGVRGHGSMSSAFEPIPPKLVAYIASGDPMRRSIPGGLAPPG